VSCFFGKGKKTALDTWNSYPEVIPVFLAMSNAPSEICDEWMTALERYTVLLYDRTSTASTVNEARKQLFTRKGRQFDALPPTRAALVEHGKRTVYQAGHVWGQSLAPNPSLPSPQGWGWDARMAENGDPSGQRYQRSPNHASSWPSVAARVPAVDVVDVARSV
jgi:hypothetical protein